MVSNFSVFGSCTCRDIFNSTINKDYKKYFKIGGNGIRLSFISIMQPPVNYDEKDIIIHPQRGQNVYFTDWIKKDFDKVFLEELKENKFEYLMMDTYYDVNFGIVDIGNNHFVTNNVRLDETKFYNDLEYKRVLKITENPNEYFTIWKEHCDLFFNFLKDNCPNLRVILNPTRHMYKVLNEDGSLSSIDSCLDECKLYNPYRDMLDEYIIKNFDVDVLTFDDNTLLDKDSIWGFSSLHYYPKYFSDVTDQLNSIIKREKMVSDLKISELNKKIRLNKREVLLNKISSRNL